MHALSINQIVKAKVGTFVVLGFRTIAGEQYAQVKEVNPNDFAETKPGEFSLPVSSLVSA